MLSLMKHKIIFIITGILIVLVGLFFSQQDYLKKSNKPNDTNSLSEADAISVAQNTNPNLKDYPSDKLPPRSITTEKDYTGWYIAFIQNGSGIPIISAQCYFVDSKRNVMETGTYKPSLAENFPSDFSVKTCSTVK